MSFSADIQDTFGTIDIYLFDQILRGRFDARGTVLDAGCGTGRNIRWFLRNGFTVHGIDGDAAAIAYVRKQAAALAPSLPAAHFITGDLTQLPWRDKTMDAVISSAVLHFARDEDEFGDMLEELWRVLRAGGLLFVRLASTIGLEVQPRWLKGRRARLPDGSERFVVDEPFLAAWTDRLSAKLLDPLKTTNVQNQRCMTTWVLEK